MTTRRLALAGLAGPPLFAAVALILTAAEWDFLHNLGWSAGLLDDPDAPWPGVIALGDWAWLQVLNYLMLAACVLGLAVAVRRTLRGPRPIGPALLALLALAFAGSAFRTDLATARGDGPDTWNATLHIAATTVLFPAALLAMLVFAWQFRKDERWSALSLPSAAAALLALLTVIPALAGARNLFFYGFLSVTLAWLALVAARARAD
ncbi:MAG: DUF998 domain-containing protein [Gaiellaceae bacterium]